MMNAFQQDLTWSEQYLPAVKQIVGPMLLVPTPLHIDQKQAADLMVLTAHSLTVAVRIRRAGYADKYPTQFTVRAKRDTGATTEMTKIMDGWGSWMLYGHASHTGLTLDRWMVLDLDVFRDAILHRRESPFGYQQRHNKDGTSFYAFDASTFPPSMILASSHPIQHRRLAA